MPSLVCPLPSLRKSLLSQRAHDLRFEAGAVENKGAWSPSLQAHNSTMGAFVLGASPIFRDSQCPQQGRGALDYGTPVASASSSFVSWHSQFTPTSFPCGLGY